MNTIAQWVEYAQEMSDCETLTELDQLNQERAFETMCSVGMTAAEHGLTIAELRSEWEFEDIARRSDQMYRALQIVAKYDSEAGR